MSSGIGETATHFSDVQMHSAYPDGIENHFWNLSRNIIVKRRLQQFATRQPQILDIGCGRGITVEYLRKAGLNCRGVDQSDVLVPPKLRPYVSTGTDVFSLPFPVRERIDTILLLDVLEHLPEPASFLQRCLPLFPQLKTILLTVPAREELRSNYDEYYGHYRRYDRLGLESLMASIAPKEIHLGYFFHLLYPVIRASLLISPVRATQLIAPRHTFLHRVMSGVLDLEERLLPRTWLGTSLWAAVRLS